MSTVPATLRRGGRVVAVATVLAAGVALASCGGASGASAGVGPLSVSDAAVGATGATVTAAYLTIENPGAADRLVAVSSPDAATVTMHTTSERGGVSTMDEVDSMDVPAGGDLRLDPGGSHLMVEGVTTPVGAGATIRLHLSFEHAPAIDVAATAVPLQELPERIGRS